MVIHMLDMKSYFEFMDQVGARYGIAPEDIIVEPGLEVPGKTADGKLFFAEMIDPEKALPWIRNDHIESVLLSRPENLIECLMLHEIYHLRNHRRNVDELTPEERAANEFEADEWALREMGFDLG
jgi:hypothetical protein